MGNGISAKLKSNPGKWKAPPWGNLPWGKPNWPNIEEVSPRKFWETSSKGIWA